MSSSGSSSAASIDSVSHASTSSRRRKQPPIRFPFVGTDLIVGSCVVPTIVVEDVQMIPISFGGYVHQKWIVDATGVNSCSELPRTNVCTDIIDSIRNARGKKSRCLTRIDKKGVPQDLVIKIAVRGHDLHVRNDLSQTLCIERTEDTLKWFITELHSDVLSKRGVVATENPVAVMVDEDPTEATNDEDELDELDIEIRNVKDVATDGITWVPSHHAFRVAAAPSTRRRLNFFTVGFKKRSDRDLFLEELKTQLGLALAYLNRSNAANTD